MDAFCRSRCVSLPLLADFANRRSVYLESLFFGAGIRQGFGEVAAWEAGFRRGCGVGYLESENILRKFDVN